MKLESMMKENPEVLVTNINGVDVADSLQVASNFGKRHTEVLRSIDGLINQLNSLPEPPTQNCVGYFIPDTYMDKQGKSRKHYWLTRDGFSLLVMGFTGPAALHWKLLYIEAFNKMEAALKSQPMDMEAVIAGVTDRVARKLIPAIFEQLEGRITLPAAVEPQEPSTAMEDGRVSHGRRLDFLYGNDEALPNFLTVYDVRDYLGIGQRQAYELVRSEGFPAKRVGNTYRIPKTEFLEWVKEQ